jgi:hypothetical protein
MLCIWEFFGVEFLDRQMSQFVVAFCVESWLRPKGARFELMLVYRWNSDQVLADTRWEWLILHLPELWLNPHLLHRLHTNTNTRNLSPTSLLQFVRPSTRWKPEGSPFTENFNGRVDRRSNDLMNFRAVAIAGGRTEKVKKEETTSTDHKVSVQSVARQPRKQSFAAAQQRGSIAPPDQSHNGNRFFQRFSHLRRR